MLACCFAEKNKLPFVLELRDITFEQIAAVDDNRKSLKYRIIKRIELSLCNKAEAVVVVTEGFKELLAEHGVAKDKIHVIPNGFSGVPCGSKKKENSFLISYFGTLGLSQDILSIFPYFQKIKDAIPRAELLIIGEGARKQEIHDYIQSNGIKDVTIMPGMTADELEPYYAESDLCLAIIKNTKSFRYTVPSKIFQIMGRGRPVLFLGPEGDASSIIDGCKGGVTLTGDMNENMRKLGALLGESGFTQTLSDMGDNGREAVERLYMRERLADKYLNVLEGICRK
jgi:glycosyltransferase involved in cell wall biosynthesis